MPALSSFSLPLSIKKLRKRIGVRDHDDRKASQPSDASQTRKEQAMANWCTTKLTIKGDWDERMRFLERVRYRGSPLRFEQLFPLPDMSNLTGDERISKVIEAWGAVSEPWDIDLSIRSEQTILRFETKHGPPFEFIRKASQMFPTLDFTIEFWTENQDDEWLVHLKNGEILFQESKPLEWQKRPSSP